MATAEGRLHETRRPLLTSYRRGPAAQRLTTVLLHPSGGSLGQYLGLAARLARHRGAVHGVRAAGLDAGEVPDDSVEAMADRYLPLLRDLPTPPDLLIGWSLGGVLAWELACRLAGEGREPAVVMVDSFAEPWSACRTERDELLARILRRSPAPQEDPGAGERAARTAEAHIAASAAHHATAGYPGSTLLLACESGERPHQIACWRRRAPRLTVRDLDCGHFDVFQPAHLPRLLRHLDAFLAAHRTGAAG
ncbi:alpha/beta fold hydrolase [Streptomyces sparsogenes]|uniref:alpha/beta fold hydrolase n=1 Tax=Streptomyces sparsogenes TaxID=67365 RepID=UPI0033C7011B